MSVGKKLPSTKVTVGNHGGGLLHLRFDKTEGAYIVEAPTPGVKRDELKIEIVGDRRLELTIEQGAKTDDSDTQQQQQQPGNENTHRGSEHEEGASNLSTVCLECRTLWLQASSFRLQASGFRLQGW